MVRKKDPLKNVEFLDLVRIHVLKGHPQPGDLFPFRVQIDPLDESKHVVFDESALKRMNEIISEKAAQFHPSDPRLQGYLEEYVGRLASELYRNGLAAIEPRPEAPEDPYAEARKAFRR